MRLLERWAKIDYKQAIPLLSGFFSLRDEANPMRLVETSSEETKSCFKIIREYAVFRLKREIGWDDSLQLQSLRNVEKIEEILP